MSFFLKMYPVSQAPLTGLSLDGYSGRLPRWGTMRSGVIYEHRMLARRTAGNAGSAWPVWATPSAADAVGSHGGGQGRSLRTDLHGYRGNLSPDWVELLMGFPPGWTSPAGRHAPVNHSMITNRRASRPAERRSGRRVSRHSATRLCRSRSTRYSRPFTSGLPRPNVSCWR